MAVPYRGKEFALAVWEGTSVLVQTGVGVMGAGNSTNGLSFIVKTNSEMA